MKPSSTTPPLWLRRSVIAFAAALTTLTVSLLLALSFALEVLMQREPDFSPEVPEAAAWAQRPFSPRASKKFRIGIFADSSGVQTLETLEAYDAASHATSNVEVRLIASEMHVIPTTGRLWLWPDLVWNGFEGPLDLLIVPSFLKMENIAALSTLRKAAARAQNVLFLGQSIPLALASGLLGGAEALVALPSLSAPDRFEKQNLQLDTSALWVRSRRIFSSPGLLATRPAIQELIPLLRSPSPLPERSPSPRLDRDAHAFGFMHAVRVLWVAAFRWPRANFLVPLEPGVSESELARAIELPVRGFSARTVTARATSDAPITGASGLRFIGVLPEDSDAFSDPNAWYTLEPSSFQNAQKGLLDLYPLLGRQSTRLAFSNAGSAPPTETILLPWRWNLEWALIVMPIFLFFFGGAGTAALIRWIQRRERAKLRA